MATLGMALTPTIATLLVLFGIARLSYNFIERFLKTNIALTSTAIIAGIIFLVFAYGDYIDLSLKARVIYLNNSMFTDIKGCDGFISPIRRNNCKSDFESMHKRWNDMEITSIGLDPNKKQSEDSVNYTYYPAEDIQDISTGSGQLAEYGNTAIINVLSVTMKGKTYNNPKPTDPLMNDPFKNFEVKLEKSYDWIYQLGIIGMREGGIRNVTFRKGYLFIGTDPWTSSGDGEVTTFKIQLVSLKK